MFNTIVIKIGSSTLTTSSGAFDIENLKRIASETAELIKQNKKVIIVSSGAIALGIERLNRKPKTIPEKQAAAAVGQARLVRQWEKAFEEFSIPVAQVLLTRDAIANRERYSIHPILDLLRNPIDMLQSTKYAITINIATIAML